MRSVPGGGESPQRQTLVDRDGVAVGHGGAVEADVRPGRHQVGGAGDTGQLQAAADVVVVHMGLDDVGDAHSAPGGGGDDLIDVARRVDDHRGTGPAGHITAVAQALELQGVDEEHDCDSFRTVSTPGGI